MRVWYASSLMIIERERDTTRSKGQVGQKIPFSLSIIFVLRYVLSGHLHAY